MKVSKCLADLRISDASIFDDCESLDEEVKVIKKIYFKLVRTAHPDKGGSAEDFRTIQVAWEVLNDLQRTGKISKGSFTDYIGGSANEPSIDENEVDDDFDDELYQKYASNTSVPSYEWFEEAEKEEVPGYKVELARSGRSKCKSCEGTIAKDSIRVGSLDKMAGSYGRWHKLECWRVPKKVQIGLTDPRDEAVSLRDLCAMEEVLLTGVAGLDDESKSLFVQHCMDSNNWAGRKRKAVAIMAEGGASAPESSGNFILIPGVDGAVSDNFLDGKTFVLTGVFPEVGGGDGHAVVKALVESFGGKAITRFSKTTDYLLAGKDTTAKKINDASKRDVVVVSLSMLRGLLKEVHTIEELSTMEAVTVDDLAGDAYKPATGVVSAQGKASAIVVATSTSSAKPAAKKKAKKTKKPAAKKAASKPEPEPEPVKSEEVCPVVPAAAAAAKSSQAIVPAAAKSTSTAVVAHSGKKARFVVPKPGVNGAVANVLDGKRFVLTGTFPEVGGGAGLNQGKDRTKEMIESFGGKVTSAVSGKTDFVLAGRDPGRSKVSQADKKNVPLIDLIALHKLLMGQATIEATAAAEAPKITNFSAGYPGQKRIAYDY